jgi:hypothetical protein
MKKKSNNQIALDRALDGIDGMGVLSLMAYMKGVVMQEFDRDRNKILQYHLTGYDDTALSNLDKARDKFEEVYDREFKKLYDQREQEYNEGN